MASLNKMEHRLDSREKQSIPVNIYTQGLFELGGVIKDIGRGGMFIEIETRDFNMNCYEVQIPIDFTARNNTARNNTSNNKTIQISEYVIHRSDEGVGVMF